MQMGIIAQDQRFACRKHLDLIDCYFAVTLFKRFPNRLFGQGIHQPWLTLRRDPSYLDCFWTKSLAGRSGVAAASLDSSWNPTDRSPRPLWP